MSQDNASDSMAMETHDLVTCHSMHLLLHVHRVEIPNKLRMTGSVRTPLTIVPKRFQSQMTKFQNHETYFRLHFEVPKLLQTLFLMLHFMIFFVDYVLYYK